MPQEGRDRWFFREKDKIGAILSPGKIQQIILHEKVLIVALAAAVGLICGYVATGFRYLIHFMQNLFFYQDVSFHETSLLDHTMGWGVVLVPAAGGIVVGLLTYFLAREAKGHGVPEVMEAMAVQGGKIRARVVLVKAFASSICLGSGGSAGREGPIVQIGSAAGSTVARWFGLPTHMIKTLVGCGAAGGIAATFNTPIAGVIFAIEIILLEFKTFSFVPLTVSAVFATVISHHYMGLEPAFDVPNYQFVGGYELPFYLILGVLSGLIAIVIIRTLYWSEDFFDRLAIPAYIKPAIGGLLIGGLGYFYPQIFGVGYDTVSRILNEGATLQLMAALVLIKIIALCVTLGSGGSGGVFAPSLFVGAALGGAFGYGAHYFFPTHTSSYGAYALVGMAAVFSGTSRATFTAIIILFEMTRNYDIILPLMFACVISDFLMWSIHSDTIYTKKLRRRGIIIKQDLEVDIMDDILVKNVMSAEVESVRTTQTFHYVINRTIHTGHKGFPIVDDQDRLCGVVSHVDVKRASVEGKLDATMDTLTDRPVIVSYPDENLGKVLSKFFTNRIVHIPVVHRKDQKKILGFLTRSDILKVRREKMKIKE